MNIGNDGLKHSFRRINKGDSTNRNISAAINMPLYFQNAIVINEAEGYRKSSDKAYVLIGTYRESDEQYFVRIIVNAKNSEVEEVKYIYAITTKKEEDAASDGAPDTRITSPSNIKIADFLEFVKRYFPNELSEDVAEQMNYERGKSDIEGLKYSLNEVENSDMEEHSILEDIIAFVTFFIVLRTVELHGRLLLFFKPYSINRINKHKEFYPIIILIKVLPNLFKFFCFFIWNKPTTQVSKEHSINNSVISFT